MGTRSKPAPRRSVALTAAGLEALSRIRTPSLIEDRAGPPQKEPAA